MAVTQDFYQNRRDLGKSSMVSYLDAWLTERSGMNKALMAAEDRKADPTKLAEQEARIRRAIADLVLKKESGSQAERKYSSDLAREKVRQVGGIYRSNAAASATRASALIGAERGLAELKVEEKKRDADALTLKDPLVGEVVGRTYDEVVSDRGGAKGADLMPEMRERIRRLDTDEMKGAAELTGRPQSSKQDAIVAEIIGQATAAGDAELVTALRDEYFGGQDEAGYFAKRYPGFTAEEHKEILDEMKKVTAGASASGFLDTVSGFTDEAGGMTASSKGSSGPGDIDDQIKELEKAADDLAEARKDALKGGRRFPRSNYMISNPNTYTDPEQVRQAKLWGSNDAEYVTEVMDAKARTGSWSGAQREIGERGGASQFHENVPAELLTDDDWNPGEQIAASLRSTGVKPGSPEHKELVAELFGAQPDGVATLFAPARILAESGDWEGAAAEAKAVDPNLVRGAYADAMIALSEGGSPFAGVAKEAQWEAMNAAIGDGGGKMGEHYRKLMELPTNDAIQTGRVIGAVRTLGEAALAAPAIERRARAEDEAEARYGVASLKSGAEVSEDYTRGQTAADALVRSAKATHQEPAALRAYLNDLGGQFGGMGSEFARGFVKTINAEVEGTKSMPGTISAGGSDATDAAAKGKAKADELLDANTGRKVYGIPLDAPAASARYAAGLAGNTDPYSKGVVAETKERLRGVRPVDRGADPNAIDAVEIEAPAPVAGADDYDLGAIAALPAKKPAEDDYDLDALAAIPPKRSAVADGGTK